MRARLPLYAKILLWFFLNLALLATVFVLLFNAQFRFDLDWVLASNASQRVDAMRDLIVGELNATPPDEWDRVIDRFGDAYRVRFSLFDDDGNHLIGSVDELPKEVRARLLPLRPSQRLETNRHRGGEPVRSFLHTTNPTRYWLLVSARLDNPEAGGPMHTVLVAESGSFSVGGLIFDLGSWLRLALGAVVFSVLFWLPLLRGITRSIGQINHATRQIAEGRFDARVSTRRLDELGLLAESINQMAARLDGFVKDQKRFLGDVAHELCSPLARLQMALGILEQRAGKDQEFYAKSATEKAGQIATLVNDLLAFSKASFGASTVQLGPVNLLETVREAARREGAEAARLTVPADLMVSADPTLLLRALANLLRNAMRHSAPGGPISVSAERGEDSMVNIAVADTGPGVPEAELSKIFDAFYRVDVSRTRETGGSGLGLAIVKSCVESCRGSVTARNRQPRGLEVMVRLPEARDVPASHQRLTPPSSQG